jgi:Ca-activated chloride channel family protein
MFFLYPSVLSLLIIPLLYFFYPFKKTSTYFRKYFSTELLKRLSVSSGPISYKVKYRLFLLTLLLFIVALARPVKLLDTIDITTNKASVIIAIDVSKSMHYTDIYPSRLDLAKTKLVHFVSQAQGLNIGILFYAKDAYALYPLSQTPYLLSSLLKESNITQEFAPNSNLFAALEGSEILLKKNKNKHIILFSDGGDDVVREKEFHYLKSKHITLSSLAITTQINTAMQTLCHQTHGLYEPFTWGDKDIHTLLSFIKSAKAKSQHYHYDVAQYEEYFSYPLAVAIFLLMLLFLPLKRPKTIVLLPLLFLMNYTTPVKANILDFWYLHKAKQAYENKSYKEAVKTYKKADLTQEVYYNLATIFYKDTAYRKAIFYYTKALGQNKKMNAKIYYNIATSYARKNKLDTAKMYYEKSLKAYEYKVTLDNLATIKKQLKTERKNLHKKYEKLHFKAIGQNGYAQNTAVSDYAIKLHKFIPSEEDKWFQKVMKHKIPLYLQKLNTTKRSSDANNPW